MLTETFLHLSGVGPSSERRLWASGISTWESLRQALKSPTSWQQFSAVTALRRKDEALLAELDASEAALRDRDIRFFSERLPRSEHWRCLSDFEAETVFVDIETTGLSKFYDYITVVGAYRTNGYDATVFGYDLPDTKRLLADAAIMVTFNGATFDGPFIANAVPDAQFPPVHIDLRYPLKRLGLAGGLKAIQEELGLHRQVAPGVNGRDAVHLWYRYLQGDRQSLKVLLEYNLEDTSVLLTLSRFVHEGMRARLPLPTARGRRQRICHAVPTTRSATRSLTDIHRRASLHGVVRERFAVSSLLDRMEMSRPPRVVGIDLTGSERKPSGWAYLDGANVSTARLASDAELVAATVAVAPDVVSIDSPLSLPPGTELNPDGTLKSHLRIHRDSELALRKRGVSVYWCLLPSMQALTLRGMRLANRMRAEGLQVIESFPGAAQDILQLPRKGHGHDELRHSIAELGLVGDFVTDAVSHDELDAITSAIVGLFFLAGQYEALGEDESNDLIVPRIARAGAARV